MPRKKLPESLSLQERVIADGMRRKIGDIAVRSSIDNAGIRRHDVNFRDSDMPLLAEEFSEDPKTVLAYARENLFAVAHEEGLDVAERGSRFDRYFDAYVDLTLRLDHKAFPPTPEGVVNRGVPEYVPDGFVDLGGEEILDPARRQREQILVDKRETLEKYTPVLKDIFLTDYGESTLQMRKSLIASRLAGEVYMRFPYDHTGESDGLGGGKVSLSGLDKGVCRHQALTYQVLAQAVGLTSRIFKSHVNGERHSANMVRLDGEWYIVDVSRPDYVEQDGKRQGRLGSSKIDRPPLAGETKVYETTQKLSGRKDRYKSHEDMYWYIHSME